MCSCFVKEYISENRSEEKWGLGGEEHERQREYTLFIWSFRIKCDRYSVLCGLLLKDNKHFSQQSILLRKGEVFMLHFQVAHMWTWGGLLGPQISKSIEKPVDRGEKSGAKMMRDTARLSCVQLPRHLSFSYHIIGTGTSYGKPSW